MSAVLHSWVLDHTVIARVDFRVRSGGVANVSGVIARCTAGPRSLWGVDLANLFGVQSVSAVHASAVRKQAELCCNSDIFAFCEISNCLGCCGEVPVNGPIMA